MSDLYFCHRPPAPHETTCTVIDSTESPSGRFILGAWLRGLRFDLTNRTWPA